MVGSDGGRGWEWGAAPASGHRAGLSLVPGRAVVLHVLHSYARGAGGAHTPADAPVIVRCEIADQARQTNICPERRPCPEARAAAQRRRPVLGELLPGHGVGAALSRRAAVLDPHARRTGVGGRAHRGRRRGDRRGRQGRLGPPRRPLPPPAADRRRLRHLVGGQAAHRPRDRVAAGALRALRRPRRQGAAHQPARRAHRRGDHAGDPRARLRLPSRRRHRGRGRRPPARPRPLRAARSPPAPAVLRRRRARRGERRPHHAGARAPAATRCAAPAPRPAAHAPALLPARRRLPRAVRAGELLRRAAHPACPRPRPRLRRDHRRLRALQRRLRRAELPRGRRLRPPPPPPCVCRWARRVRRRLPRARRGGLAGLGMAGPRHLRRLHGADRRRQPRVGGGPAPARGAGTGLGLYQALAGGCALVAGVWAGLAWGDAGRTPLLVSGAAVAALAVLLAVRGRALE